MVSQFTERVSHRRGAVVWLYGLSGSGKSTIAALVIAELRRRRLDTHLIDGDHARATISRDLGFSIAERQEHIRRLTELARTRSASGSIVIVAAITPLESMRDLFRSAIPEVVEIFVSASLSLCEERDPKGLYKKARSGLIINFTGLDSPFELPIRPITVCHTDREAPLESAATVLRAIATHVR